jgi:hypothetical protein
LADWLHRGKEPGAGFAAAAGDSAFQTDGTMVNTWEGWRELRLGVFAKRPRGQPVAADQWDSRRRPPPSARVRFGGSEAAAHFGPRLRRGAGRLGVRAATAVTVLADGAEWIWKQPALQRPGAVRRGDGRGPGLAGGGAGGAAGWRLAARTAAARRPVRSRAKRQALDAVEGYFGGQQEHLGYAGRLAAGQRIGSGLVEGACQQVIGRRRKPTGARGRIRRANRMATLCCTLHGDTWKRYWDRCLN